MRDFSLDFQPRRPGLLTVVLLLAGVLLCADAWLDAGALRSQLDDVEAQLAKAKRRADRIDLNRRDSRPENVFQPTKARPCVRPSAPSASTGSNSIAASTRPRPKTSACSPFAPTPRANRCRFPARRATSRRRWPLLKPCAVSRWPMPRWSRTRSNRTTRNVPSFSRLPRHG